MARSITYVELETGSRKSPLSVNLLQLQQHEVTARSVAPSLFSRTAAAAARRMSRNPAGSAG